MKPRKQHATNPNMTIKTGSKEKAFEIPSTHPPKSSRSPSSYSRKPVYLIVLILISLVIIGAVVNYLSVYNSSATKSVLYDPSDTHSQYLDKMKDVYQKMGKPIPNAKDKAENHGNQIQTPIQFCDIQTIDLSKPDEIQQRFGLVIDFGSSGSRISIFHWYHKPNVPKDECPDQIDTILAYPMPLLNHPERKHKWHCRVPLQAHHTKTLYHKVKPGISSYSQIPQDVVSGIRELLDYASSHIPQHEWENTILLGYATAGMRVLAKEENVNDHQINSWLQAKIQNPDDQANIITEKSGVFAILQHVIRTLLEYKFKIKDLKLISGKEEGIFDFISLQQFIRNGYTYYGDDAYSSIMYELDKMEPSDFGTIDIGGASVQMAITSSKVFKNDRLYLPFYGDEFPIEGFVKSFLGLGVNEARLSILRHYLSQFPLQSSLKKNQELPSVCHSNGFEATEIVDGKYVPILGKGNFTKCIEDIRFVILQGKQKSAEKDATDAPIAYSQRPEIGGRLVAFDHAHRIASFFNLTGYFQLSELARRVKEFCYNPHLHHKNVGPIDSKYCFEGAYIYLLFVEGFKIKEDEFRVAFVKDISGADMSWSIGSLVFYSDQLCRRTVYSAVKQL